MPQLSTIVSSVLGAGYSRIAPGTVGSAFAIVIIYILTLFVDNLNWIITITAFLSFVVGIWYIDRLPASWEHDDNRIVIDEFHGIFVSLIAVPITLESLVIAFILFRFFDILKPLGIKSLDRLNSSHGVMLDDTLAGVYSNIVIQISVGCGVVLY